MIKKIFKKKIFKKKISIKTRMLFSILALIFTIFIGIVISFNLVVNSYIEKSSHGKIDKVRDIVENIDNNIISQNPQLQNDATEHDKLLIFLNFMNHVREKEKSENINSNAQFMMINSNYNVIFPNIGQQFISNISNYQLIADSLQSDKVNLNSDKSVKIQIGKSYYYVSFAEIKNLDGKESYYTVMFIDISNTLILTRQINMLLIIIMVIASILAIVTSIIMSRRIAKPIDELCEAVKKIGDGDFKRHEYNFSDKELDELCNNLNKASEKLDKYDKEQKTFFQNVSHELRTPLMSIKGYAEGIKYDIIDKDLATDIILGEGDRLGDLIEEILYLSKMDNITKDYILEERDMREILSECTVKQRMIADKKGIEFSYDFDENPVLFVCNEKSIYRAFSNIIENSIRYAKSTIKIGCKNNNDRIIIYIEDNGSGINEIDLPYIFDRFYKGSKGKHGIGLSIVKSIIEKHNGEILVENSLTGAKFTIILYKG